MPETPTPQVREGQIPLSPDELAMWRGLIDKSREARKKAATWWEANLKKYAPDLSTDPDEYGSNLNTNRDFTLVERKKADLFYQRPDVIAVPSPLMAQQAPLLDTHTKILNECLGPDDVNAKALVHQVLFDILCTAGMGYTLMGYDSATVETETVDPMTGQPMTVPVPVYERVFWEWFSPKQRLLPHDLHSTDLDNAASWLGMEFEIPLRTAKRKGWVPPDFTGTNPDSDLHFGETNTGGDAVVRGVLIFYKSALFRDDRVHPLHQTKLVLIEGVDVPAEHVDSPYQTLDAQGKLTPDSLIGFPFHHATIRTLTDSCEVPSDCTISRPLINELNKFRTQMIEMRDAQLLGYQYNVDTLPTDALHKAIQARVGGMVGLPGDAFAGEGAIKPFEHKQYPRENFEFNNLLDNDLARTHALDSNQQGVSTDGEGTATEAQILQSNVNARLGFERGIILDWYCKGVTKFSTLLMRFLPLERAAQIVGPQFAQEWDGWRKQVPATVAFTALPDSSLRNDIAAERKRWRDEYSFFANDPFVNRLELLKHLMPRLGYPPNVLNPKPPEKSPEPTKPGLSLKGEDLNPLAPQFPILVEVLGQCGIKISPQAIQQAQSAAMNQLLMQEMTAQATATDGQGEPQTDHPGAVTPVESLNKHAADLTGGMQGSGQPAPMGAGGIQ